MKRVVSSNFALPYINALVKQCSFLYGIDYSNELKKRLYSIKNFYISDEMDDKTNMYFSVTEKSIYMNSRYITRNIKGEYAIDYYSASDLFKHSLMHELLHVSSNRDNINGIVCPGEKAFKTSLNEGITQMLTDDIMGYVENKFLGSYNVEKIIANILRVSFGNDVIVNSYFIDHELLEAIVNSTSGDKRYFNILNIMLSRYSENRDLTRENRLELLLRSVVLNIIIPTYNNRSEEEKEKYLSKLIYDISFDAKVKSMVVGYINEYVSLPNEKIKEENTKIFDSLEHYERESDFIKDMSHLDRVLIRNDGSIYMMDKKTEVTNKETKEKIYVKLFEANGYKKYMTPENIKKFINSILKGDILRISHDTILKKRIMFCGIKDALLENGYYILNDFEELDKSDTIKVRYINKKVTFDDYKKMAENFSLCKTRVGKNEYSYSVVYNSTKNELEDETLRKMAYYALNWMDSAQSKGREGLEEAYKTENRKPFYYLLNLLCIINEQTDHFSTESILSHYKGDKEIVKKFLGTPIKLEWVYEYINMISKSGIVKEKKGLSYNELVFNNYLQDSSEEEAREIVARNR